MTWTKETDFYTEQPAAHSLLVLNTQGSQVKQKLDDSLGSEPQLHSPLLLYQLLCRVQLLAELLHLLVVAEAVLIVLVELQTLPDVTERRQRRIVRLKPWRGGSLGTTLTSATLCALPGCTAAGWASGRPRGCRCAASPPASGPGWPSADRPSEWSTLRAAPVSPDPTEISEAKK